MLTICSTAYSTHTRETLREVPVTDRGTRSERWLGIQHSELVDALATAVQQLFGFRPLNEKYLVSPTGAALIGGFELGERHGGRTTAPDDYLIKPVLMSTEPQEVGAAIGFTHSNDSRQQLSVVAGGRVFLCSNGVVTGETKIKRRHTTGLKLLDWLLEGLQGFWDGLKQGWNRLTNLQDDPMTIHTHDENLLRLARTNTIPWRLLGELDTLWHKSLHLTRAAWHTDTDGLPVEPDVWHFKASAWDWYNACTHIIKRLSPAAQYRSLTQLTTLCLDHAIGTDLFYSK